MTGNTFNYSHIRLLMTEVSENEDVLKQFPKLSEAIDNLAIELHDIIKDIDQHLSKSKVMTDRFGYEIECLAKLRAVIETDD